MTEDTGLRHGTNRIEAAWNDHASALRRFVGKRVASEADADDLVQETFLRLLRSDAQWPENVLAWLYRTAGRLVIDHYRTRRSAERIPDPLAAPEPDPAQTARDDLIDCLPGLIYRLPEPYREALTLSELKNMPQREIASRQAISLSGAKSRIQRGRRLLRGAFDACCRFERERDGAIVDFTPKWNGACVFPPVRSS